MAPGTGKDKHVTSNTNPLYNDDDDEHQFPGGRTDGAVTEMIEAATAGMVGGAAEVRKAAMMDAEHEEALGESTRNGVFGAFCFLEVMANFDAGVLPVSIRHIMNEMNIDYGTAGWLGSLVYFGLVLTAPLAGKYLTAWDSQRKILIGATGMNAVAVLIMVFSNDIQVIMASRLLIGASQSPVFIYCPVWVDEFSPDANMTLWMSLLQAAVAVGIMLGYIAGGIATQSMPGSTWCPTGPQNEDGTWAALLPNRTADMSAYTASCISTPANLNGVEADVVVIPGCDAAVATELGCYNSGWRWVLAVQAVVLGLYVPFFLFIKGRHINAVGGPKERVARRMRKMAIKGAKDGGNEQVLSELEGQFQKEGGAGGAADAPFVQQLKQLLSSGVFVLLVMSLSGLYFVVTGIQFWITDYLTLPVEQYGMAADPSLVVMVFAFEALSGPIAGVFFGGWAIDRIGGYDCETGKQAAITLRICNGFGLGAVCAAIPCAFATTIWGVFFWSWVVLFFGGALLPPCTGVCMNAVVKELRPLASAMSMFAYNCFGYACAPLVGGYVAEAYNIKVGFQVIMLSSTVAWMANYFASLEAQKVHDKYIDDHPEIEFEEDGTKAEHIGHNFIEDHLGVLDPFHFPAIDAIVHGIQDDSRLKQRRVSTFHGLDGLGVIGSSHAAHEMVTVMESSDDRKEGQALEKQLSKQLSENRALTAAME